MDVTTQYPRRCRGTFGFNGATCCQVDVTRGSARQPDGHRASMEPPVARWMLPGTTAGYGSAWALQWSHLLPGGCYVEPAVGAHAGGASMEPPVARWMLPPDTARPRCRARFNGATCCQVDVTRRHRRLRLGLDASMEPPVARWMLPSGSGRRPTQGRFNGATCCQVDVTALLSPPVTQGLTGPVSRTPVVKVPGLPQRSHPQLHEPNGHRGSRRCANPPAFPWSLGVRADAPQVS